MTLTSIRIKHTHTNTHISIREMLEFTKSFNLNFTNQVGARVSAREVPKTKMQISDSFDMHISELKFVKCRGALSVRSV